MHCDPETAPCALVCKQDAFYKVTATILAIDASKCNGCGACLKACPYGAIKIEDGKAKKCDLCAAYDFEIACIRECPLGAIKAVRSNAELKLLENALGWNCFKPQEKIRKIYRERPKIVETENSRWYLLAMPELSAEEAKLLKTVLEKFQNNGYSEDDIEAALAEYCQSNRIVLEDKQKAYLKDLLRSMAEGFGPIDELLCDSELEEIALIGLGKEKPLRVFHQRFGWCNCNVYFTKDETVRALVNKMLRNSERRLTLNNPCVNGTLPDGSRINATLPPVSLAEPTFTIRKFNVKHFTPEELVRNKTFNSELMAFLWCALQTDCSIVLAGNTGSGKTTSLNAIFSFVPASERIVVIEETPELSIPHKHLVKLAVCNEKNIKMHDLIENSLRMRPDRIVVSEVRNSLEAKAFINTLLAGQGKGSYTTFHANSAEDAIKRFEFLGIKRIDIASIDLLLVQRRWPVAKGNSLFEERRIIEVAELNNETANMLYSFDYSKNRLKRVGASKRVYEKIERTFKENAKRLVRKKTKEFEKCLLLQKPFGASYEPN